MKKLTSTGVYFTSSRVTAPETSLPLLPGNWVEKLDTDAPMMVGEFVSANGTKYVMVVNLSLENLQSLILKQRSNRKKYGQFQ
jgi:hypothetical protein